MSSKYLIYTCCFHQTIYTDVLLFLINSFKKTGSSVDLLIYTTAEYREIIQSKCSDLTGIQFHEKNFYKSMNQARISKLDIFDYPGIENYEKIIYIDADTIFLKDPLSAFDEIQDDVVYTVGEGNIMSDAEYWGRYLFLKENANYPDREGIASFIMGFKNIPEIKKLFTKTKQAFYLDMYQNKLRFYDQPFLNFFFIHNNMCNTEAFKRVAQSRQSVETGIQNGLVAMHFAGCPGHGQVKMDLMKDFQTELERFTRPKVSEEDKNRMIFILQKELEEMRQKTAKLEALLAEQV
jgi:lipopolysaccharide biosynthesis glycosyltransferase